MSLELEKTREILKKVRHVELRTRHFLTDAMVGAYHSVFKGQGVDFEEVREYCPGDEVRTIDWNVSAKMGKPFVKTFREERQLTLILLVDLSASGDFGSLDITKRERAAELASLLAFSAARNNDKVGLLLFTDRVEHLLLPKKGKPHILRILRDILFFRPQGIRTNLTQALDALNRILKRKAIVVVLSDFLQDSLLGPLAPCSTASPVGGGKGPDEGLLKALQLTARRHDLICFSLGDPREEALPAMGHLVLEDAETGQQVHVQTASEGFRQYYQQVNERRIQALASTFRRMGVEHVRVTEGGYVAAVRQFFKNRAARR